MSLIKLFDPGLFVALTTAAPRLDVKGLMISISIIPQQQLAAVTVVERIEAKMTTLASLGYTYMLYLSSDPVFTLNTNTLCMRILKFMTLNVILHELYIT